MKLLIDTADLSSIREILQYCPVSGVTTNPSILWKAQQDPALLLKQIREEIGSMQLHVQAVGTLCEEYLADAEAIANAFGNDTFIKIPAIKEGFRAMKILKENGLHVTATAVYYPHQALLASAAGADYIAPYYNRIFKEGMDPDQTILAMKKILEPTETKILAASFKTVEQVSLAAQLGIDAMTLSPDIYGMLNDLPVIDKVTEAFNDDFHRLTGTDCSLKDVLKS